MLSDLILAKLVWMPSVFVTPNCYMHNFFYLYLVPLLLNSISKLLAYVAALFVNTVFLFAKLAWLSE